MCSTIGEVDIEDIKHKQKTIDENIWNGLINDFEKHYEGFESKKDVINFQKYAT